MTQTKFASPNLARTAAVWLSVAALALSLSACRQGGEAGKTPGRPSGGVSETRSSPSGSPPLSPPRAAKAPMTHTPPKDTSAEPAPVEPAPNDPAPTDPASTDPMPTEPEPTEPPPVEPEATEPPEAMPEGSDAAPEPEGSDAMPEGSDAAPEGTGPAGESPEVDAGWKSLFDGKTLTNWKTSEFGGHEEPRVEDGNLIIPAGATLSGVTWAGGKLPKMNYEIALEGKRMEGNDFWCGLTFPVGDSHASLILGGWGGGVSGISSLDGYDAHDNNTSRYIKYEKDKWYKVRMRVTPDRLQAWLDREQIVDVDTTGKKISVRPEVNLSKPFGLSTYVTTAALRNIEIRELTAAAPTSKP